MEFKTRMATTADREALKALWQNTFHESRSFLDWFFNVRFLPEFCTVSECDGRIVSAMHGLPAHIRVRDSILRCVLVSGVATLPQYRHQGCMRRGISRFFAEMRALGIPLAVYHPVDFRIYAPLGHYAASDAQLVARNAAAPQPAPPETPVIELSLLGAPGALYRCYTQATRAYSMALARSYADFSFKCADYAADSARCLAILNRHAQIEGYCIYFVEEAALRGEECLALSADGYRGLYAALALRAEGKRLTLRLPPEIALRDEHAACCVQAHSALGVIDVAPLLKAVGLTGGAIEITDPLVSENAGIYALDGTRVHAQPQLRLTSGRLAQWAVGYRTMSELMEGGFAEALDHASTAALDAVGRRRCYLVDEY